MHYDDLSAKKSELDGLRPFSGELEADLSRKMMLELACTENGFEGVSFTRRETSLILFDDETVPGRRLTEHIRTRNVAKAFSVISEMAKTVRSVDENDVKNIHRIIVRGLDDDNAGVYRGIPLTFGGGSSEPMPDPFRVSKLMDEFGLWLYTVMTLHPVGFAAEAHLRLMAVQPFTSGNSHTARMFMNLLLLKEGYPPVLFSRREKKEYWDSLEKAVFKNDRKDYDRLIYRAVNRALDFYLKAGRANKTAGVDMESEPYFLQIGKLAKETGERVSTLRYWTSLNLLETAGKTSADYTLYSSEVIPKIKRLKELKEQRYTLDEIRNIMQSDA